MKPITIFCCAAYALLFEIACFGSSESSNSQHTQQGLQTAAYLEARYTEHIKINLIIQKFLSPDDPAQQFIADNIASYRAILENINQILASRGNDLEAEEKRKKDREAEEERKRILYCAEWPALPKLR